MLRVITLYSLIWLSTIRLIFVAWRLVTLLFHGSFALCPLSGSFTIFHCAVTAWLSDKCIVCITACVRFTPISYTGSVSISLYAWTEAMEASLLIWIVISLKRMPDIIHPVLLMEAYHFRINLWWTCMSRSDSTSLSPHVDKWVLIGSRIRTSRFVSCVPWIFLFIVIESFVRIFIDLAGAYWCSAAIVMVHVPLDGSSGVRNLGELLHVHLCTVSSVLSYLMHCLRGATCSTTTVPVSFIISVNIIFVLITAMGSKVAVRSLVFVFVNQGYFLVRWIHFVIFLNSRWATQLTSFPSHSMKVWARGTVGTIQCVWLGRALRWKRRRVFWVSLVCRRSFDIWFHKERKW